MARLLHLLLALCILPSAVLATPGVAPSGQEESSNDQAFKANLERRLARHPYLKSVDFEWVWDYDDFVVLVQKPRGMPADYVEKVAKLRSAESISINATMKEGLAKIHGVSMRESAPRMPILAFENPGELEKYLEVTFKRKTRGMHSYYNSWDRMLALCEAGFSTDPTRVVVSHLTTRHWRAMQVLHAYSARSEAMPGPFWFQHGMANQLSGNNSRETTREVMGKASHWGFNTLCLTIKESKNRYVSLPRLEQLLLAKDYRDVSLAAKARAERTKLSQPTVWRLQREFQLTAGALVHFLTNAASEDLRGRMSSFTDAALKGKLRHQPFQKFFEGVNWLDVERQFWTYVWDRWDNETGQAAGDNAPLKSWLREIEAIDIADGVVPTAPAAAARSPLDFSETPQAQLAIAMASVRAGDPESAQERLQAALDAGQFEGARQRFKTELARVKAWIELRDAYLNHLAGTETKLVLKINDKKLVTLVSRIEPGQLILGKNNRKFATLALKDLDPLQLIARMKDRKSTFKGNWAMAYPAVLGLGSKAKRWLKGDSPEMAQLALDFKHDYPARRASIEAAEHLLVLSADPLTAPADGLSRVQHLNRFWQARAEVDWIEPMDLALSAFASEELGREFDGLSLGDLLAVPVAVDPDGFVELVYDFSDPRQINDWIPEPVAPESTGRWNPVTVTQDHLRIENGKLIGLGTFSRTHALSLSGPQSFRWNMQVLSKGEVSSERPLGLRFSLCTAPDGSYAGVYETLFIEVFQASTQDFVRTAPKTYRGYFERLYKRELRHDGKETLTAFSDGEEFTSGPCKSLLSGQPNIFVHSDYTVEIDDVVIRGQLTDQSLAALRRHWVQEQLALMGFE